MPVCQSVCVSYTNKFYTIDYQCKILYRYSECYVAFMAMTSTNIAVTIIIALHVNTKLWARSNVAHM